MTDYTALITFSVIVAAAPAAADLSAQVNSPEADGYIARAGLMYADRIYRGTSDQAAEAAKLFPEGHEAEQQLYLSAMASLRLGSADALGLLREFAVQYPGSVRIPLIHIGIGDCLMAKGDFPGAMREYALVTRSSLAGTDREDLAYRRGYCALLTGDYGVAATEFARLTHSRDYARAARFYTGYIAYVKGDYSEALRLFAKANGTTEPECAAPYYTAQIRYRQSDWGEAAKIARQLIKTPRIPAMTPEMTRILGESLWNSATDDKTRREAVDLLWTYAASVDTPEPSALYILGVNEYDKGNYSEAIGLLQRVITDESPLAQSAYLYLGQAYSGKGNTNAALMAFEHAYRMDFSREVSETAFYNYAVTRIGGGTAPFASTVKILEDFLHQYPDSKYASEVETYLVNGYLSENDYEAALAGIERIKHPGASIEKARQRVLFVLGTRDYTNGRYAQALERLKAACAITPARGGDESISKQAVLWIGDALYALGQYDAAANEYKAFIKTASSTDPNRATALYDLGYARFASRKYKEALTDFKEFVSAGNADNAIEADAYTRMGDCRYYANDFSAAAADYRCAFDLSPSTGDYPLYQLAIMKGLLREHRVKIQTLDEMITRYPGSPLVSSALLEKAESYVALNNQDAAIATYTDLTERFPSTAQGRKGMLQLAIIRLAAGQRQEAVEIYRKVIATYPTSEEATLALDDLKRISAEDGTLDKLTDFLATVSGAPSVDRSEYDDLSFNAAEKVYIRDKSTDRLSEYLKEYPQGTHRAQALFYMAKASVDRGDNNNAIELTSEIVTRYPDAEITEEALLIKAEAESATGRSRSAFDTYSVLEQKASAPGIRRQARLGIMRQGVAVEEWDAVIRAVEHMATSSTSGNTERSETGWSYGKALSAKGRYDEAAVQWQTVIDNASGDEFASRSAVDMSRMLLDQGKLQEAYTVADKFINSNPSQPYWLARGFIVYSDILRRKGETFEADEYLRSLRNNYPGTEEDIFNMIDERLKDK